MVSPMNEHSFVIENEAYCFQGFNAYWDVPKAFAQERPLYRVALAVRLIEETDSFISFLEQVLLKMKGLLAADAVTLIVNQQSYSSVEDYIQMLRATLREDGCDYPEKIRFECGGHLIAAGATEFWFSEGGADRAFGIPYEYFDSHTFAFYFSEDYCAAALDLFAAVCADFAIDLQPCIQEESSLSVAQQKNKAIRRKLKWRSFFEWLLIILTGLLLAVGIIFFDGGSEGP